jgi:protease YdgD
MLSTLLVLAAISAPAHDLRPWLHKDPVKPAKPGVEVDLGQNDSCRWANDRECDDPGVGTGACEPGTDYSRRCCATARPSAALWTSRS